MNTTSTKPIHIEHYSDVLCVWAFIAQARIEELENNFPNDVQTDYRFMPVFGDVQGKIATEWADRGGIGGYAAHVQKVAGGFEHIAIDPQAWLANTPTSSLPAHLMLCGVKTLHAAGHAHSDATQKLLDELRQAFFVDLVDISNRSALLAVAERADIDVHALQATLDNGTAHAQLAADITAAKDKSVRSSPTLIFNEGRQTLAGNVGYRVIEANIRELLHSPGGQQSWC